MLKIQLNNYIQYITIENENKIINRFFLIAIIFYNSIRLFSVYSNQITAALVSIRDFQEIKKINKTYKPQNYGCISCIWL